MKNKKMMVVIGLLISASAHAMPDGLVSDSMYLQQNHPDVYAAGKKSDGEAAKSIGAFFSKLIAKLKGTVTVTKIEETGNAKSVTSSEQPSQAPSKSPDAGTSDAK